MWKWGIYLVCAASAIVTLLPGLRMLLAIRAIASILFFVGVGVMLERAVARKFATVDKQREAERPKGKAGRNMAIGTLGQFLTTALELFGELGKGRSWWPGLEKLLKDAKMHLNQCVLKIGKHEIIEAGWYLDSAIRETEEAWKMAMFHRKDWLRIQGRHNHLRALVRLYDDNIVPSMRDMDDITLINPPRPLSKVISTKENH